MNPTGSDILIRALREEGVEVLFGHPGGAVLFIYDAIARHGFRHVLARHEQGAVHMADGYARASGRPGVALVTSGPALTNAITGIATAYADSIPVVIFSGQVPLKAYGAVWGDGTPIQKVEVKLDDGPWREVQLDKEPLEKYSWRFYSLDLGPVAAGKHTIVSRATDAKGRVQPTAQDDEIALKKTYWEAYQQWRREFSLDA